MPKLYKRDLDCSNRRGMSSLSSPKNIEEDELILYSGETPEGSIADAVNAIVYSAPRTELKELHMLREMLMHKVSV